MESGRVTEVEPEPLLVNKANAADSTYGKELRRLQVPNRLLSVPGTV